MVGSIVGKYANAVDQDKLVAGEVSTRSEPRHASEPSKPDIGVSLGPRIYTWHYRAFTVDGSDDKSESGVLDAHEKQETKMLNISALFEAHLTVADMERSMSFYEMLGLSLAALFPERSVASFWIGQKGTAMPGLWTVPATVNMRLHIV